MSVNPSFQIENIQDDLRRFSGLIHQLSGIDDHGLAALRLSDQLEAIHICIHSFETRCQAIHIHAIEEDFFEIENDILFDPVIKGNRDWKTLQREARHANQLARQLTGSLRKVHTTLDENRDLQPFPNELIQINQAVENTISGLVSEWNTNLE
ncbi:MAG: hypothetical protein WA997_06135 [Anaerolineales bacterium]